MLGAPPELVKRLRQSTHTVILSGSGTSAESGVPTFRDAQTGLWARFRPEELATPEAFARDPALVWKWYQWRRGLIDAAEPNPGHRAIAELATLLPRLTLITQNVDGLHQRAGSRDVIEFHGNIHRNRCSNDRCEGESSAMTDGDPPSCPTCGAWLRPDVVWFGEAIPQAAMERAMAAVVGCDVFIAVGTSAQVQPAAGLANMAQDAGAALVEVNPNTTPLTAVADFSLAGPSGEVLPALVADLRNRGASG